MGDEESKLPLSRSSVKDGIISLLVGVVFIGWGVFRFNYRPILSGFLLVVGIVNIIFAFVNFGIALTDRKR